MGLLKRPRVPADDAPLGALVPRTREELLADLKSADPAKRRIAAGDLASERDVVAALVAQLEVEPDRAVREVIGTSLVGIGASDTPALVAPLLRSDDATLRNDVRELLDLLPGAERVGHELLKDEDPDIRMFAIEILVARLGAQASDLLAELLDQEDDVNVNGLLAEKLGEVGSVQHIDALQSLRERVDAEGFLAFVVGEATERILMRATSRPERAEA